MEDEKYGIEAVKKLLGAAFETARIATTLDSNSDGKITIAEIFSAVTGGFLFKIAPLYEALPEAKKEFKDLSPEEIQELVNFATDYDILEEKLDNIEELIKKYLNWLNYNYRFYTYNVEFFKKKEEEPAA